MVCVLLQLSGHSHQTPCFDVLNDMKGWVYRSRSKLTGLSNDSPTLNHVILPFKKEYMYFLLKTATWSDCKCVYKLYILDSVSVDPYVPADNEEWVEFVVDDDIFRKSIKETISLRRKFAAAYGVKVEEIKAVHIIEGMSTANGFLAACSPVNLVA